MDGLVYKRQNAEKPSRCSMAAAWRWLFSPRVSTVRVKSISARRCLTYVLGNSQHIDTLVHLMDLRDHTSSWPTYIV